MKTTGNTILITGGTSGIGLGLAREFHQAGNTVIVAGQRTDLLERIVTEHHGMRSLELDVSDPASIATAHETVTKTWPHLNVLVNNAGIMAPEDLLDPAHLDASEAIVTTNLLGPIRMLAAFLPFLAGRPDAVVVNVSSGLAFVPLPATPTYNATKAALHSFTESLRVQLAHTPVEVIELVPPAVRTDMMGQADDPTAMPLQEFLDEVMTILRDRPDERQILVDRVRTLRFAEADGTYDKMLGLLSGLEH